MFFRRRKRSNHPPIDYKLINRLEDELGLGHSDYGDKGISVEALAAEKERETAKVIDDIEHKLYPEKGFADQNEMAREIMGAFAVPPHIMGKPRRTSLPNRDLTYHGGHGIACPCADCYGRGIGWSDPLVSDLRRHTRVRGQLLPDPLWEGPSQLPPPSDVPRVILGGKLKKTKARRS